MTKERVRSVGRALCLTLTGLSVGWIMGLSASAVTQAVLATVLGMASALVVALPTPTALGETKQSEIHEPHVPLVPRTSRDESLLLLCLLSLFVACGSTVGVYIRSHDILGLSPSWITSKWKATGFSDSVIAQRLFDQVYPAKPTSHVENEDRKEDHSQESTGNPHSGALYSSVGQKECDEYNSVADSDLRRLMLVSNNHSAKVLAESTTDPKVLRVAVKEFLCGR